MELNILFVCSGPTMYDSIKYYDVDTIKHKLPTDIYNYVVDNELIANTFQKPKSHYIQLRKLPDEYIKRLIKDQPIISRDLDRYRDSIIETLKQLYPSLSQINYTTIDPTILDPKIYGDKHIMDIIHDNDNKGKIPMKFQEHHTMKFQKYIAENSKLFDVVWFLQCTDFSWVIDPNENYLNQFKQIISSDGLIIHMDWNGTRKRDETGYKQPVGSLIDIKTRFDMLPGSHSENHKKQNKINWFLDKVIQVQPGIYKFKKINKLYKNFITSLLF